MYNEEPSVIKNEGRVVLPENRLTAGLSRLNHHRFEPRRNSYAPLGMKKYLTAMISGIDEVEFICYCDHAI